MGNLNLAMFSYLLIFYIINNRIGHIAICIGGGVTDQDNFIADLIIAVNRKCKLNIGAGQLKLNILIIVKLETAWCHHIGRIIIYSGDLTFDCHFTGLIGTADLLGAVCPEQSYCWCCNTELQIRYPLPVLQRLTWRSYHPDRR